MEQIINTGPFGIMAALAALTFLLKPATLIDPERELMGQVKTQLAEANKAKAAVEQLEEQMKGLPQTLENKIDAVRRMAWDEHGNYRSACFGYAFDDSPDTTNLAPIEYSNRIQRLVEEFDVFARNAFPRADEQRLADVRERQPQRR